MNGIAPYYTGWLGHPTAFRPIGYPGTLAALYSIFGTGFIVAKLFNVFLSIVSMFCSYKLAKKFFGKVVAILALVFIAIAPLSIAYVNVIGSELIFSTILVLSTYVFFFWDKPYIMGLLSGYLALIRPIGALVPLVFFAAKLVKEKFALKKNLKYFALFLLFAGVVVGPWIFRNYLVFGEPIYSTNGGYVFYINNNDNATGSWNDPYQYPNSPFLKYKHAEGFDEVEMNFEGQRLAMEWIANNPVKFIEMGFLRLKNSYWSKLDDISWSMTLAPGVWSKWSGAAVKIETLLYRPFYILVFVYIFYVIYELLRKKRTDYNSFILLLFLYFNLMMFVLEGNSRYVFPMHPFYFIGVAFLICKGISRLFPRFSL